MSVAETKRTLYNCLYKEFRKQSTDEDRLVFVRRLLSVEKKRVYGCGGAAGEVRAGELGENQMEN